MLGTNTTPEPKKEKERTAAAEDEAGEDAKSSTDTITDTRPGGEKEKIKSPI